MSTIASPAPNALTSDATDAVQQQSLTLVCRDKIELVATLFTPTQALETDGNAGPKILISSATGVPQTYYARFATYLIESGASTVMTYDYRGISQSAGDRSLWKTFTMKDWAVQDFVAAAEKLSEHQPAAPMAGIGHSYGGQALGLSGVSNLFQRYCGMAAMSGYWRNTGEPWSILLKTHFLGLPVSHIMGRIPSALGLGETMPGTIYQQWIRWVRRPEYFFDDPTVPEAARFKDVTLPYLAVRLSDDAWGTDAAVHGLTKHYSNADRIEHTIEPDDQSGHVGHLGFFRQKHRDNHWPVVRDFLLQGKTPN